MATLRPYDAETARLLASPPEAGQNRHEWLFRVQARLYRAGLTPAAIVERLEAGCRARGWDDRVKELQGNMDKIVATADLPAPPPSARAPAWPAPNHDERVRRYATPPLFSGRPVDADTAAVLHRLYGDPEAWVCAAKIIYRASTFRLADIAPMAAQYEFIVPNAMRAERGTTALGKPSERTKSNACREQDRRFMVVEFDTGDTVRDQAAVLSSLHSPAAPLCLAVFSGGKSVHGWFNVSALGVWERRVWFAQAAYLGADASLWDTSKLVRMPGGRRHGGGGQEILFWEPEHA